ncbi:ribonuclease H-like domain-containing protein [Tanacetum coccineum]|uniref:Ribonuclease H-like domain-containing protein n=1 Tax=Tanacetum coccineum TaxID=301880 RepID=A0ABQ5FEX2_9ASTR
MHAVPPPMTGNYMPSGPDVEVDDSKFTYGPKQTQPSESESQSSEFDTCESNISAEPSELVSEPVVNESNVKCQPKVWSDAPIIEEYESDSEDECVSIPTKQQETPSFANKQRTARKADLNNGWKNVQRVNKQNQFVPSAVLTRTGTIPVNTAKASSTKNFSTARQSFNRQTVLTSTTMKVNTVKPIVNRVRPANVFYKTHSPSSRPFKKTTVLRTYFLKQKVNTAKVNAVSTVGGKRGGKLLFKPSERCNWRPTKHPSGSKYNGDSSLREIRSKEYGIVDSGVPGTMTGNKAYLFQFREFVSFTRIGIGLLIAIGYKDGLIKWHRRLGHCLFQNLKQTCKGKPCKRFTFKDFFKMTTLVLLVRKESNKGLLVRPKQSIRKLTKKAGTEYIIDAGDSETEDESAQNCFVLPIWPSYSSKITPDLKTDEKRGGPRQEEQAFMDELERLKRQEIEAHEEAEALRKQFAQETEKLIIQEGAAKPSSTNIFSTVSTPAKASSTNLVNTVSIPVSTASPHEGLSLSDPTNPEEDDSEIPPLEDIYQNTTDGIFTTSSYDDEGAVADFTNLETVVNVSPIPTSRIHSSHPTTLILGDPNSAVQTRSKLHKSSGAHAFVSYVQKQRRNNHKDFQHCLFACFLSQHEPKKISEALEDESWVDAMQEELLQFEIQKVWILVDLPFGKKAIGTKWVYRNKKDERGVVVRNKARILDCDEFEALSRVDFDEFNGRDHFLSWGLQVKSEGKMVSLVSGYIMIGSLMYLTASRLILCSASVIFLECLHLPWNLTLDSDYAGSTPTQLTSTPKKILTGIQQTGGCTISWQGEISSSLTLQKADFVALYLQKRIYAACKLCGGPSFVLKIHTNDNVADLLTKAFDVSSKMAVLDSCPKHNMVAYLEKSEGNVEFHEIIDFLTRSSIHHALTVSPIVSTTFVEQFWTSAKSKTINNVRHITAKVAGKSVSISEASIRSDLLFDDADGIDSLPNQAIFDAIQQMGYEGDLTVLTFNKALFSPQWRFLFHTINHCLSSKSTSWDQIPTNIATAVICLTSNQKYNFSKLIFDGMLRHLDAKKKFVMYPRFISIFLGKQLTNVSVPLDHFPVNTLTSKVFSFMVKKGKHFSGKVTPLFATMLVQPTQDEGASSERPSEALPTPSPAPTSDVPNEPQTDSSPAQTSEVPFEQQTDQSPRPSPTTTIPDSIPETSGENLGGHSSSDKSLSGNEGDMTIQGVYDLCLSLCKQVSDQAKEIQALKAQITKLKKQAKPVIKHHKAYLKSVSLKQRFPRKSFSKKHRVHKESVSKQGRKFAKGESSVQRDPLFDEIPEDTVDHMDTENAQDEGRTREIVDEDKEIDEVRLSTEDVVSTDKEGVSTDKEIVSTDRPIVSTDGSKISTDEQVEGTEEHNEGTEEKNEGTKEIFEGTEEQREGTEEKVESTDGQIKGTEDQTEEEITTQATQTLTSMIFGDDEKIAKVLLNMSQAKAVSKEKEKGVELKDVEETDRPRPTSTRSLLTLKLLPKIDPKDKGKKKIEEEDESESESDGIPEAEKKFKQLESDEEMARKIQEEWEEEEERNRIAEEQAANEALIRNFDDIKARIEADRLLAEKLQEQEREQFTIEERAKFLHDTIAAQRKFLAQQRSEAIRNRPPTKNQLRNQMMTYLKHVGNFKHAELKIKKFEEVQALYEKIKRSDEDFISIGSAEDERLIKKMNEKGVDSSKDELIKEESKERSSGGKAKKRKYRKNKKLGTRKKDELQMKKKKWTMRYLTENILSKNGKQSVLELNHKLIKLNTLRDNLNVVIRSNGHKRYFSTLMSVLSIFDREDLNVVYQLVMDRFQDEIPKGFDRVLWGDLMVMFNTADKIDLWNAPQDGRL